MKEWNPAELDAAAWISVKEDYKETAGRPAYEFMTTFTTRELPEAAVLTVTAHGIYEAFINGRRIGDMELTPGLTSYRSTLQVQRFDVLHHLVLGVNHIVLRVSDGWFRGRCGAARIPNNFGDHIALIAAINGLDGDKRNLLVATGSDWRVGVGTVVSADLMDGQIVDLRRTGLDETAPVVLATDQLTADRSRLKADTAPPVRRTAEYSPVEVSRLPGGRQIVDFGTTVNGWIRLRSLGPAGTTTTLTHGEWLDRDGNLTLDHLSFIEPDTTEHRVGQRDSVTSRGVAGDLFEPRHTTHGFRYVAIDGREDDIDPDDILAVLVRSDLRATGKFRTDNVDLKRLHHIAVQSWITNTCDIPTDCPQRERWGYTGDFQIFAHTATFLEDIERFGRKWLRSLADDQLPSGRINNVAPYCGDDTTKYGFDLNGSAGWGDAATVVPWELYEAYGNVDLLRENYDMMRRWVDYIADKAQNGRHHSRRAANTTMQPHERHLWDTGWHWGEWLEPDAAIEPDKDQAIVATAYFARSARIVADTAELLGWHADSNSYRELSALAADAWRTEFLREDGLLTIETQATYTRALAFDLVPKELQPATAARLVELIAEAGGRPGTGFLSTPYLLPVLADQGYTSVAFDLLFQRNTPGWMVMLDRGATAIWEAWEGVDERGNPADSLNHYSKGAVITFLHEYVAGLRRLPGQVGYRQFQVMPHLHEKIGSAGVDLETADGRIIVDWARTDRTITVEIVVPDGCRAELVLPGMVSRMLPQGSHRIEHQLSPQLASSGSAHSL